MIVEAAMPATDAPRVVLRPAREDELRYLLATWLHEYKFSSSQLAKAPWAMYKHYTGPKLRAVLESPRTRLLVAALDSDKLAGWLAYAPGTRIHTVHWAHTRGALDGQKWRRRGVMSLLLEAAELGPRFLYTHKGAKKTQTRGGRGADFDARLTRVVHDSPNIDEVVATRLRARGITAVYMDINEWLK